MGIRVDIIEENDSRFIQGSVSSSITTVVNNDTSAVIVTREDPVARSIEVMRGLPGVNNVIISATEPDNPSENLIWLDIS